MIIDSIVQCKLKYYFIIIYNSFLLGHSYVLGAIQTERGGPGLSGQEELSGINIVIHNNTLVSLKAYTFGGVCVYKHALLVFLSHNLNKTIHNVLIMCVFSLAWIS